MMPAKGLAYSVSRRYGDSCSGSNLSFTAARSLIAASDPQFSPATQNHEKQVAHWQSRQVDQDGAIPDEESARFVDAGQLGSGRGSGSDDHCCRLRQAPRGSAGLSADDRSRRWHRAL